MSVVAVAGGTGKLGRAIVEAIIAAGKFEVVILARKVNDALSKEIGAPIVALDYESPEAIASVLEKHKVGTVISALTSQIPPEHEQNLIQGADKSSVTKRFLANAWGIPFTEEIIAFFPPMASKISFIKALEATSLEFTSVHNGYFSDYFVSPNVKTYMPPLAVFVDVPNKFAAIPGSGDSPIVFTHTFDIAKLTAALLTRDKWEKDTFIIGDSVSINEFVSIAEAASGSKFTIEHDSIEKLKEGKITELPVHPNFYSFYPKETLQGLLAAFGIMWDSGLFDLKPAKTLNEEYPDIKVRTIKELITEFNS